MSEDNSAHAAYRREMQQRQTVLFGTLTAALATIMVITVLIWTRVIPLPFKPSFARDKDPNKMVTPCIADGSKATEISSITANVYNAANRTGIAGEVAGSLRTSGFSVTQTENWSSETTVKESTRIVTSPHGTNVAYTTAQYIPKSVVHYGPPIDDEAVSVMLDVGYDKMLGAKNIKSKNPKGKLTAAKGCVQVSNHGR